jgi:hypothetical protein
MKPTFNELKVRIDELFEQSLTRLEQAEKGTINHAYWLGKASVTMQLITTIKDGE